MYCRNCGKELPEGSNFCPNCGKSQKEKAEKSAFLINGTSSLVRYCRNHKLLTTIYIMWFLIQFALLLSSSGRCSCSSWVEGYYGCKDVFYPLAHFCSLSEVIFGDSDFKLDFVEMNHYDISEFFVYTLLLPFIIWCIVKVFSNILEKKQHKKEKLHNKTIENTDEQETINSMKKASWNSNTEETNEVDNTEKNLPAPKDQMLEAEMVTMPLLKRLIASIIDHVAILILLVVIALFCMMVSPYEGPGTLGVISAFLDISPKYLPEEFMQLDIYVTVFSIFIFIMYFGLAELRWKASLGKYLLKGILLDSDKIIIKGTDAKRMFTRLGLYIGYALIFHFQMGLGYFPVIILYIILMSLPILFTKQSLLDLMTGTIYAKRK